MKKILNKTIIITGASRGLGKSIAESLYDSGHNLVLVCRRIHEIKIPPNIKSPILTSSVDITKNDEVKKLIVEVINRFGRIDVLINNAGRFIDKCVDQATDSDYDAVFNVNVKGAFTMSHYSIPHMKRNKGGLIINIGSKITHRTNLESGKALYAASKHAIEGFSLALQRELQKDHIRVTCLQPATMQTFLSFRSRKFLKLNDVAKIVSLLINMDEVNFDNIVFQSTHQFL